MPSSYSSNLLLELMADGENEGLWGDITNTNLEILGRAISGVADVTLSGTSHTLTVSQGELSEGHNSVLILGGSPTGPVTVTIEPNTVTRVFTVQNNSGQSAVFTQGSGGTVTVPSGEAKVFYCDGGGSSARVALLFNAYRDDNIGAFASVVTTSDSVVNDVAVGRGSGDDNSNTIVGNGSLLLNSSGTANTALGRSTLVVNSTGFGNTACGRLAASANSTGVNNTAVGDGALANNSTGSHNTGVGEASLSSADGGDNNIAVGWDAGTANSPFEVTSESDRIVMGNNDHTHAYIKVGWTVTSDAREKTNLQKVPHGLGFVDSLEPVSFQFKQDGQTGPADGVTRYGFLAQDVLPLEGDNPVIVDREDPDRLKITESHLLPVFVNAIKDLNQKIKQLETELEGVKNERA